MTGPADISLAQGRAAPPALQRMGERLSAGWGRLWFLPLLPAVYSGFLWAGGDLRPEHVLISGLVLAAGYGTPRSRAILRGLFPLLLIPVGHDLFRRFGAPFVTPDRVVGCGLRELELALFPMLGGMTVADVFQRFHHAALDLFFAVPYAVFWVVVVGYSLILYSRDNRTMSVFVWSVTLAHCAAFVVWAVLPAAPPWYIRAHGCLIDTGAAPSAAALLRIDAMLGLPYFETFYSRAGAVFGALPSMHCAFPAAGLFAAWPAAGLRARLGHLTYLFVMVLASMYLDHHWLIDGLLGIALAAVSVFVVRRLRTPAFDAMVPVAQPARAGVGG